MMLDRAQLLGLTAPEMTVLLGGLRSLGITHNGYGNFSENSNELTNDYLTKLLDMSVSWQTNGTGNSFESIDRTTGDKVSSASRVDLVLSLIHI